MASIAWAKVNVGRGIEVHWASFTSSDDCDFFRSGEGKELTALMTGAVAAGNAQIHGAAVVAGASILGSGPGSFVVLQHFGSNVAPASILNSGWTTMVTRPQYVKPVAGTSNEVSVTVKVDY